VAYWAHARSVPIDAAQRDQLVAYLDTLQLWNRKISLMSDTDAETIAWKHFADSLYAVRLCGEGEKVIDLGSGAGFPGIPIAVARPDAEVCLIESRDSKASFLKEAVRAAGLKNTRVVWSRIEDAARNIPEWGTLAISRALTEIDALQSLAEPLLSPGGRLVAMKTKRYLEELRRIRSTRYGAAQAVEYDVPNAGRRFLVTFTLT
jgi:16S rRNA (guanine527-N7)-methyltransferase